MQKCESFLKAFRLKGTEITSTEIPTRFTESSFHLDNVDMLVNCSYVHITKEK